MTKELGPGFRLTLIFTILTGLLYPAVMTGVSELIFPKQANGSLVSVNGKVVGSSLIGQNFSKPEYFHSRPSAAGSGYDATASGGTNLGPTNQKLLDNIKVAAESLREENPNSPIPIDMVTASASGLDPHITPAAAEFQVPRITKERRMNAEEVRRLVHEH